MDLLLAWIASFATAFTPIIIKLSSSSLVKSPWLFNILWLACAVPPIAIIALIQGGGIPQDWSLVALMGVSSALFFSLYTTALYKINVSVMSPLFSLRTVFAVILGVFLLDESIPLLGIGLVALIILISPLAAYDANLKLKAFLQKPVLLAVIAMLALAFTGYFTNLSVNTNGFYTTVLWHDLLTLIFLLPSLTRVDWSKEKFNRKSLIAFGALGVGGAIYIFTASEAYSRNLALSSVIISLPLSMILAVLLSKKLPLLKESHSKRVYTIRFTAAGIMVASAIWLSLL